METRRRRIVSHKREDADQIKVMVEEDQAKKDLEVMKKPLLDALFVRRTTMTVAVAGLDNVLAARIQITW